MMLVYKGINALSKFRGDQLVKKIRKLEPSVAQVTSEYVHFVDCDTKLPKKTEQLVQNLLEYGEPFNGKRTGQLFLVIPRPGTISPWSSKATDIAKNCGLDAIKRIERGVAYYIQIKKNVSPQNIKHLLHDRMTEAVVDSLEKAAVLFQEDPPKSYKTINISKKGKQALELANAEMGLALAQPEVDYLYKAYKGMGKNPTDVEIMMFAQLNSEHSRHKIFNADWKIDGKQQPKSLFGMIKNTYEKSSDNILSAYSDNAAVLEGSEAYVFFADSKDKTYRSYKEPAHIVAKVETHNHPTAIAPFPGAATGSGGEIRDGGATGRGAKPKAGLTGYNVSNLMIPGHIRPWEKTIGKPDRIASPLDIMVEAPLGAAGFNNEFGRPNIGGYFRTYEQNIPAIDKETVWGYHKPIMLAGGVGNIRTEQVQKRNLPIGAKLIIIGGPAMLIGLGGSAASSKGSGDSKEELDFASVQRANAEMQRRAQEVINTCWSGGAKNPILSIHDVGAGGLSNAFPELVNAAGLGAQFDLRAIPNAEPGMSPLEIWCNEAQERYVMAIEEKDFEQFAKTCERERCPFAVVGTTTKEPRLVVSDNHFKNTPIDIPLSVLFGDPPKMQREVRTQKATAPSFSTEGIDINEAAERVLQLPSVGSKKFLITIGDRTVGGMVTRDQMVGKWQVPVSDVAVTANSFKSGSGEAMAVGERPVLSLVDSPASGRMAVGEALTNICAAKIGKLGDVKLSANWMAAAGYGLQDQQLFETVKALGEEFCPDLGLTIPVGKDSLSMRTVWEENGKAKSVTSPLSVLISAFSPVSDTNLTLTPELQTDVDSLLIYIDLGAGKNRMAGSALSQVYNQLGSEVPDADPTLLKNFFALIQELNKQRKLLAYHDRSDGGLFAALCEMAFAGRSGLDIDLSGAPGSAIEKLFNEELGAVIQVSTASQSSVMKSLVSKLGDNIHVIGKPSISPEIMIKDSGKTVYTNTRSKLEQLWSDTSYCIAELRDNPICAKEEFYHIKDDKDPGISPSGSFTFSKRRYDDRPKVAILREQGVNGHVEMAAAFSAAGFIPLDVHLTDLISGDLSLDQFRGIVAGGGFAYGDILGAGNGWAKSILFNPKQKTMFSDFFKREDTFSLGVCNGCQMFSAISEIIPGAEGWPRFLRNRSEQFEARLVTVEVQGSPSIFFRGMEGSRIPIPVAHGEGRAELNEAKANNLLKDKLAPLQYINNYGRPSESYPFNPNGSPFGITAVTTPDGRSTILMPHPERAFLTQQLSWHPEQWGEYSPWFKIFQNAREWVSNV